MHGYFPTLQLVNASYGTCSRSLSILAPPLWYRYHTLMVVLEVAIMVELYNVVIGVSNRLANLDVLPDVLILAKSSPTNEIFDLFLQLKAVLCVIFVVLVKPIVLYVIPLTGVIPHQNRSI